nr:PAS domain-containing sensor histidine kinase [Parvularcula dongshanensis]
MDEEHVATRTWRVTPDLMCIVDRERRFVAVNPSWTPTLGWSPEEIVGQPFSSFLHSDDVEPTHAAFARTLSGEPVRRFENRYRTKDGGHRWLSWVAVPEGEHIYASARDVTEDKVREQTITDQREEADLREQLLAVLGHDLRNPLGAVVAGIRLLAKEADGPRSHDVLRQMRASTVRMEELIGNMMDFARVRLGDGLGLDREPCADLDARVRHVIEEIEQAYPDARIELDMDLGGAPVCDGDRVMQVFSNLLGNAVTHGTRGSPIEVTLGDADGRLSLSVCNRGEPISDHARETLFQPFFKGEARTSPQGLGLGLYICAQVAEAHGGRLDVTSDEALTCFTLDVPARG